MASGKGMREWGKHIHVRSHKESALRTGVDWELRRESIHQIVLHISMGKR